MMGEDTSVASTTPGPWAIEYMPNSYQFAIRAQHNTVAYTRQRYGAVRRAQMAADARLIAAAPDLLTALERLTEAADALNDDDIWKLGSAVGSAYNRLMQMERWTGADAEPEVQPWVESAFTTVKGEKFRVRLYRDNDPARS